MTEKEVVHIVACATEAITDFNNPHWAHVDSRTLNSCFDKGFIRWVGGKLSVTPLGRRSCGGTHYTSSSLSNNERF